jgi:hypothetical protein
MPTVPIAPSWWPALRVCRSKRRALCHPLGGLLLLHRLKPHLLSWCYRAKTGQGHRSSEHSVPRGVKQTRDRARRKTSGFMTLQLFVAFRCPEAVSPRGREQAKFPSARLDGSRCTAEKNRNFARRKTSGFVPLQFLVAFRCPTCPLYHHRKKAES